MSRTIEDVAIIGIAGGFPQSRTLKEFWNHLCQGHELISFFSKDDLKEVGEEKEDPSYIKAKGALDDVDLFDADLFGYSTREAECIDPQQRLFLQWGWEALEEAGYNPDSYEGLIGVFASASLSSYFYLNLFPYLYGSNKRSQDEMLMVMGNEKDFLATRLSYKLNLKGPSRTVQTACSSSLVAIHDACQNLLNFECDIALAGGVSVTFPQKCGYLYSKEGINSPDGHCRTFDAQAAGTVMGNGGGIVVLKRLSEAIQDRDTIRAIIRGSAINNDGSSKIGYTAPSIEGQSQVIAAAQLVAQVEPETISYIECHGTATHLGDPIEMAALTAAFRSQTEEKRFCAIGSVKTNIGHLDAAAGVAGLIKTVLSLENGYIVPSLHFQTANPKIAFEETPFFVNNKLIPWEKRGGVRRAGVSSFGIGGTNAHLIVEEAPQMGNYPSAKRNHLLPFSAQNQESLTNLLHSFSQFLEKTSFSLADIAYTLQVGRKQLSTRTYIICSSKEEACKLIQSQMLGHSTDPELMGKVDRWMQGEKIAWDEYAEEKRRRVPLPTYCFKKERYFIYPKPLLTSTPSPTSISHALQRKNAYASPENKLEKLLVNLLENSLRTQGVGVEDNFFELGGDSLLALEITDSLRRQLYIDITLQHLFNNPSVRSISLLIKEEILKKIPELSDEQTAELMEIL